MASPVSWGYAEISEGSLNSGVSGLHFADPYPAMTGLVMTIRSAYLPGMALAYLT